VANDKTKNLKLLAGASIILILAIFYIGYTYLVSKKESKGYANLTSVNNRVAGKETAESDDYRETLQAYNENKAEDAVNNGETYISVLSGQKEEVVTPKEKEKAPVPIAPPPPAPAPAPVVQAPKQRKQHVRYNAKTENKNLIAQTQALMTSWNNTPTHTSARVSEDGKKYVESISYHSVSQETIQQRFSSDELDKIVDDYDIVPAILQTELDSDENSVVKAYVPNGKYKGAYLFADGYKLLYETIDLTFTRMLFKGETYDITAKPIDPKTMRTSLSGKVNTRWFQKVILPAIANGFGEIGDLYKNSNRKIIQNGFNSYESTGGLPRGESVAGVMLGGASSRVAKTIEQNSNKIPLKEVVVDMNTVIGIQFIGPVYKSDSINYKKNKDSFNKSSINNAAINAAPQYGQQSQLPESQFIQTPQQQNNQNFPSNY
jgi:intracellular multiplication protein IcmE